MNEHVVRTPRGRIVSNPPIARLLFDDTRLAIVWLVVRVLIGWDWLSAALSKLTSPDWMQTGDALKGFWTAALKTTNGKPVIANDYYRSFIQGMLDSGSYVWFAKLVAIGEFTIGLALILGAFVGVAAFLGAFMNWNYLMAGSVSVNPILFIGALMLILAWKTAGYYGLDRFIVPRLGAVWEARAAYIDRRRAVSQPPVPNPS